MTFIVGHSQGPARYCHDRDHTSGFHRVHCLRPLRRDAAVTVGTAVFLLVIFYLANRAIAAEPELIKHETSGSEQTLPIEIRSRVARGLSILLDVVLFVIAFPVLLLSFGVASNEIWTLTNRALYGFEVGGIEVSLVNIGFALGLFAIILVLTRMLQRWLGGTVLHPSRTEQGLGNSIQTGIGYLGFAMAALAGFHMPGSILRTLLSSPALYRSVSVLVCSRLSIISFQV